MKLNFYKCKIMHIGKRNSNWHYHISDEKGKRYQISETKLEKDLGLYISSNLKWNEQSNRAASKANSLLGMLKRTFTCRDPELWKTLYTSYIRPQLEYAIAAWNPYQKGDIKTLEKIQRRCTRI